MVYSDIYLPQDRETPVSEVGQGSYRFRYAYARSADCQSVGDPGQDFLAVRSSEECLVFVLCDGVSQSFMGDLAARVLGEALLTWVWDRWPATNIQSLPAALMVHLKEITPVVSMQVQSFPIPPEVSGLVRAVLEEKRALGSQSTFILGLVDWPKQRLFVAWMGDSRLRLWDARGELRAGLQGTFITRERWSSQDGPVGDLHTLNIPLGQLQRVVAYSDGLAGLDEKFHPAFSSQAVTDFITQAGRQPASDDITFFDLALSASYAWKAGPGSFDKDTTLQGRAGDATLIGKPPPIQPEVLPVRSLAGDRPLISTSQPLPPKAPPPRLPTRRVLPQPVSRPIAPILMLAGIGLVAVILLSAIGLVLWPGSLVNRLVFPQPTPTATPWPTKTQTASPTAPTVTPLPPTASATLTPTRTASSSLTPTLTTTSVTTKDTSTVKATVKTPLITTVNTLATGVNLTHTLTTPVVTVPTSIQIPATPIQFPTIPLKPVVLVTPTLKSK